MSQRRRRRLVKTNILRPNRRRSTRRRLAPNRAKRKKHSILHHGNRARRRRRGIRRTRPTSIVRHLRNRATTIVVKMTTYMIMNRSIKRRQPRRSSRHRSKHGTRRSRIFSSGGSNIFFTTLHRPRATHSRRRHMNRMMTRRGMRVPPTNRSSNNDNRGSRTRPRQLRLIRPRVRHR